MPEFCFVKVDGGAAQRAGGSGGNRNSRMMRQHVHKAVLRNRQQSALDGRMKHFTGTQFAAPTKTEPPLAKTEGNEVLKLTPAQPRAADTQWKVLMAQPTLRHPYTEHTASLVQLPIERIDYLFKSRAELPLPETILLTTFISFFRDACEPLFSVELVEAGEAGFRMEDVFPGCLDDATYLNALLLAILLLANKGAHTVESLELQGRALKSIRQRLLTDSENLNHADVGGILILQGIAYRWNDVQSHEAHCKGLIHVRRCQEMHESCLTAMGERAMFWSDLSASILIGSTRFGKQFLSSRDPVASGDATNAGRIAADWLCTECRHPTRVHARMRMRHHRDAGAGIPAERPIYETQPHPGRQHASLD